MAVYGCGELLGCVVVGVIMWWCVGGVLCVVFNKEVRSCCCDELYAV